MCHTTDLLQPMDLSVNKPIKDFLRQKFQDWYSDQIAKQLEQESNMEAVELQPVDFGLPIMKELAWCQMAG